MKSVQSVSAVDLHDMPQDRATSDFDHRFGLGRAFLSNAGSRSTGENHNFHDGFLPSCHCFRRGNTTGRDFVQPIGRADVKISVTGKNDALCRQTFANRGLNNIADS